MIINRMSIGDPVEVKRVTLTAEGATEEWIPATVTHSSEEGVSVCFADGTRSAVERGRGLVRRQPVGPQSSAKQEI